MQSCWFDSYYLNFIELRTNDLLFFIFFFKLSSKSYVFKYELKLIFEPKNPHQLSQILKNFPTQKTHQKFTILRPKIIPTFIAISRKKILNEKLFRSIKTQHYISTGTNIFIDSKYKAFSLVMKRPLNLTFL